MKAEIQLIGTLSAYEGQNTFGAFIAYEGQDTFGPSVHIKAPARYNWAFSSSVCVKAEIQFGFVPPDSTPFVARSSPESAWDGP